MLLGGTTSGYKPVQPGLLGSIVTAGPALGVKSIKGEDSMQHV